MSHFKRKLLFFALSASAYISPMLMIISLFTNYWLSSIETVLLTPTKDKQPSTLITKDPNGKNSTSIKPGFNKIEAVYGLWEMCRISGMNKK